MSKTPLHSNKKLLVKYSGLAFQLVASLGLSLYLGLKLDSWLKFSTPVFVWVLPLLFLIIMMYQIIKDTSKKNSEE